MRFSSLDVLSIDDASTGTQRIAENEDDLVKLYSGLSEELKSIQEASAEIDIHCRSAVLSSFFRFCQRLGSCQESYESAPEPLKNQYLQMLDDLIELTKDFVRRYSDGGLPLSDAHLIIAEDVLTSAYFSKYLIKKDFRDLEQSTVFSEQAVGRISSVRTLSSRFEARVFSNASRNQFHRYLSSDSKDCQHLARAAELQAKIKYDQLPASEAASSERNMSGLNLELYHHSYDRYDLDDAVVYAKSAAKHAPNDDDRSDNNQWLSEVLQIRFRRDGDSHDIIEATDSARLAMQNLQVTSPIYRKCCSTLSNALRLRFDYKVHGNISKAMLKAYQEAMQWAELAAEGSKPGSEEWMVYHETLAEAHYALYEISSPKNTSYIDKAIEVWEECIKQDPESERSNAIRCHNISLNCEMVWVYEQKSTYLDKAIEYGFRAVVGLGTDLETPEAANIIYDLGRLYLKRRNSENNDASRAAGCFLTVFDISHAPANTLVKAGSRAADLLHYSDPGRAADILRTCCRLLPKMSLSHLSKSDRIRELRFVYGLGRLASAVALEVGWSKVEALSLLEEGRGIIFRQSLGVNTSDEASNPSTGTHRFLNFNETYVPISFSLSGCSYPNSDNSTESSSSVNSFTSPSVSELLIENLDGPIAIISTSSLGALAYVVSEQKIETIDLPFSQRDLETKASELQDALKMWEDGDATGVALFRDLLKWQWDVIMRPIFDQLGSFATRTKSASRLWLVPCGIVGRLPLHVSGDYSDQNASSDSSVGERGYICSYSPSIRALLHSFRQNKRFQETSPRPGLEMAIVVNANVEGEESLTGAEAEIGEIASAIPSTVQVHEFFDKTAQEICSQLPPFRCVHFISHGKAFQNDPSKSHLVLQQRDGKKDPLTVEMISNLRLTNTQLVYLSACETAESGGDAVLDETLHIATAFQIAGCPQVIATKWKIPDREGPATAVVGHFYRNMSIDDGKFSVGKGAQALHDAIRQCMADKEPDLLALAAYIHIGY